MIESPISDAKLAALGVSHDDMLGRIRKAVSFAAGEGITVAFFGVDGSRAGLEFFRRAYEAAVEAGAQEVAVVDTIGIATPEGAAYLVGQAVDWLDVPVHWHGHDDFGLATAAAVAAVQAGASWVQGTVNGMGERAGNANLIEVALALEALYGIPTRLDLGKARELAALVRERSGYELAPWTPITGENLFTRESGAVASQFHDPPAIEPYASGLVGAERRIVLGKKSGLDSIRLKAEELGLDVPADRHAELLAAVKELGARKKRLVTDAEFRTLVTKGAADVPSPELSTHQTFILRPGSATSRSRPARRSSTSPARLRSTAVRDRRRRRPRRADEGGDAERPDRARRCRRRLGRRCPPHDLHAPPDRVRDDHRCDRRRHRRSRAPGADDRRRHRPRRPGAPDRDRMHGGPRH